MIHDLKKKQVVQWDSNDGTVHEGVIVDIITKKGYRKTYDIEVVHVKIDDVLVALPSWAVWPKVKE